MTDEQKFRNALDNILLAFKNAPPLPIESLSAEDQAKWTDTITGILMALGPYAATGRPVTFADYMMEP